VMVTGALGNVGGYVAKYLLENGQDVVAADINVEALQGKYGDKVKNVYFDFTDSKTFSTALQDVDRVFIMRPPHLGKPEDLKPFVETLKSKGGIKLVRKITYANSKPSFAKKYWIEVRGLDKEYSKVMVMLYMMTRMGTAKKTTITFEEVMDKKPQTFRQFIKKT